MKSMFPQAHLPSETSEQIFERTRAREVRLSRLLIFFISGGLLFMAPFVCGFSAKWLPIFLGTPEPNSGRLGMAVAVHVTAIISGLAGFFRITAILLAASSLLAIVALTGPQHRTQLSMGLVPDQTRRPHE